MAFKVPNQYRIRKGVFATSLGLSGAFLVPLRPGQGRMTVIATDGMGLTNWEHVSVSLPDRCPTWDEMCRVKGLFWDEGDCVVQFHPPKSDHVNNHRFCLHLWRQIDAEFPRPPSFLVGNNSLGVFK